MTVQNFTRIFWIGPRSTNRLSAFKNFSHQWILLNWNSTTTTASLEPILAPNKTTSSNPFTDHVTFLSRGRNQVTIRFVPIKVSLPILVTSGVIIFLSLILCCYLKSLQRKIRVEQGYKVAAYKPRKSVTCEACAICLEDFEPMEKIVVSRCQHTYHNKCLERWLEVKNSCPICLTAIKKITTHTNSNGPSRNCSTLIIPSALVNSSVGPNLTSRPDAEISNSTLQVVTQPITTLGCSYFDLASSSYALSSMAVLPPTPLVQVLMPTQTRDIPTQSTGGPTTSAILPSAPLAESSNALSKILKPSSWSSSNNNYYYSQATNSGVGGFCSRSKNTSIVKVLMPSHTLNNQQPILSPLLRVDGHPTLSLPNQSPFYQLSRK